MTQNRSSCTSQNGRAKSAIAAAIARIVRRAGLDYDGWRYVAKQVRKLCDLRPAKKGRKLPRVLSAEDFRRFYQAVDQANDVQHALMLRLVFYTAVRVSELCGILVAEVDLEKRRKSSAVSTRGNLRPFFAGRRSQSLRTCLAT